MLLMKPLDDFLWFSRIITSIKKGREIIPALTIYYFPFTVCCLLTIVSTIMRRRSTF